MPKGTNKDDLVAAVIVHAKEKEEEVKEKKQKPKFNAKYLIPILIPIIALGAFKGCTSTKKYIDTQPIHAIHYNIPSPDIYEVAAVNMKGQEGMTSNILNKQDAMDGEDYNAEQQFDDEKRASEEQQLFEQMEKQIDANMEILISKDSTQEEIAKAAKKLLEIDSKLNSIYVEDEAFVEEKADEFENASKRFPDSNTEAEISVVREIVEEYKANLGLTNTNVEMIMQIVQLSNDGYLVNVEGKENQRGDYFITGEAIKEFAKKSDYNAAREKYKAFDNYVKGKTQPERGIN